MKKIPPVQELFVSVPLYTSFDLNEIDRLTLYNLMTERFSVDSYCIECNNDSVFLVVNEKWDYDDTWRERLFHRECVCSRNARHRIFFVFRVHGKTLIKIGQSPSLADLAESSLRKYKNVLSADDFRELSKAVGLASHGVGIGSFVYLRRIFERLIEEAHQNEKTQPKWDEDVYIRSRVEERIKILKHSLPEFLVQQSSLYGILSKGLHELSEQECMDSFPIVRVGIELILDQKVELRIREEKMNRAKKEIQNLQQKLAKS